MVFNLALHYTQNVEDAEEIMQDVFVKVHQKLSQFQFNAELKTWIYRIAINQSLDLLKAKRRKKRFGFLISIYEKPAQAIQTFNHPGIELENKEAYLRLFNAINQLPPQQKTALILLKIEQRSQVETAEIMLLSTKAVESLFQRAKKKLLTILNKNEGI